MCKTLRLFYACMIICLFHFLHRDPRYSNQGVVRVIHNETGSSAGNFFQILSLDIIDFHLLVSPSLGVIGSQRSGFLKDAVRQLLSLGLYDYVGARNPLRVEPPVAAVGKLEVEFFVLVVVFSDIDMESVAGKVVERAACDLYLFPPV